MGTITITTKNHETYSAVSNFFIDYYMTEANGEFVKVYLYLVRILSSRQAITIADIADHFNLTEKDICRAIRYWIKQGVLQLEYTADKVLAGIILLPLSPKKPAIEDTSLLSMLRIDEDTDSSKGAPEQTLTKTSSDFQKEDANHPSETSAEFKKTVRSEPNRSNTTAPVVQPNSEEFHHDTETAAEIASIRNVSLPKKVSYKTAFIEEKKNDEDFGNLLYQTETYFSKPLTQTDINTLLYIYEELSFSPDLLEYLIEYCVSIGKKSCRYIEAVALEWYKNGITTVEAAKVASKNYNSIYVAVLKQLGIPRRVPTPTETAFIDTWYNTYAFNKNIIIEACKRAITTNPHSANFNYVNGILESWHKQNVRKLSDIEALDKKWADEKKKRFTAAKTAPANQFNQYQSSTNQNVVNEFENLFLQETNQ